MNKKTTIFSVVLRSGFAVGLICLGLQSFTGLAKSYTAIRAKELSCDINGDSSKRNKTIVLVADSFELYTVETDNIPFYAGNGDSINNELWIRYKFIEKEELLVKCRNDEDPKKLIVDISEAVLSDDHQKVYFMCSAWATSDAIHEVDLTTRKERFVCDGNSLEIIKKGKFKGKLLVNQHRYHKEGSYDFYFVVDENGKTLKTVGEEIPEGFN